MSDLAGFFTIAPSNGYYFAGTSNNDVLLYPETEQQRVHLGTKQTNSAVLVLSSNVVLVNGKLEVNGDFTASNFTLSDNSLSGSKITDGTITQSKLATNSITSNAILDRNIIASKLATDSVTSNAIKDGNVTLSKLEPSVLSYMSGSVSSQWSNSNNLIYILNSNVAIGTSNQVGGFTSAYNATFNSNVTIFGQLTVNNVQYVTSNVIIYNTQTVNSNITTLNTLTFSNTTGSLFLDSSNANLGIDYPTPEYKLDVNGDIRAVSYYLFSDIRKKKDIQLIEHAVDKLSNISGYTFTLNGQRSAGLIAQEVISVLPEVISQDSEGYLNISYDNVIGLLVNAVKELTTRVQVLEQRLSS